MVRSLAITGGLLGGLAMILKDAARPGRTPEEIGRIAFRNFTGYDWHRKEWKWQDARATLAIGAGIGVHKAAVKLDVNKNTPAGFNL